MRKNFIAVIDATRNDQSLNNKKSKISNTAVNELISAASTIKIRKPQRKSQSTVYELTDPSPIDVEMLPWQKFPHALIEARDEKKGLPAVI